MKCLSATPAVPAAPECRTPHPRDAAGRPQAPASVMRAPSHSLCRSFAGTNFSGDTPRTFSAPGWEAMDLRPNGYLLVRTKPRSPRTVPRPFFGKSGWFRPRWLSMAPSLNRNPQSFRLYFLSSLGYVVRFLEVICGTLTPGLVPI